jgi:hypothetical protein
MFISGIINSNFYPTNEKKVKSLASSPNPMTSAPLTWVNPHILAAVLAGTEGECFRQPYFRRDNQYNKHHQ